jgi:hypothetical protein
VEKSSTFQSGLKAKPATSAGFELRAPDGNVIEPIDGYFEAAIYILEVGRFYKLGGARRINQSIHGER